VRERKTLGEKAVPTATESQVVVMKVDMEQTNDEIWIKS